MATSSRSELSSRGQIGRSNSGVSNSLNEGGSIGSAEGDELWALHELGEWFGVGPSRGKSTSGELRVRWRTSGSRNITGWIGGNDTVVISD
jgi:hypothetical protein